LISTGFPYRSIGHIDLYLQVLGQFMTKSRGLRRPGSAAIDLAYVASGRFDGFFETGLLPWDVAAGLLLVEEGGGRVTDYRDRQNPVFAEQLLATNGNIHAEMLELVKPMQDVYQ
jgi:myo-inositol-1(or 4)-monophosphatase